MITGVHTDTLDEAELMVFLMGTSGGNGLRFLQT